jgi:hypothetical protein
MRADRERKLSRLIWQERIKRSVIAVLAAAVIFGAYVLLTYERTTLIDKTAETAVLGGTVVSTAPGLTAKTTVVHIRLEDGREIDAMSTAKRSPVPGAHAEIRMARHQSGRVIYEIARFE